MNKTMVERKEENYGLVRANYEGKNFESWYGDIVVKLSDIKESISTGDTILYNLSEEDRKYLKIADYPESCIENEGDELFITNIYIDGVEQDNIKLDSYAFINEEFYDCEFVEEKVAKYKYMHNEYCDRLEASDTILCYERNRYISKNDSDEIIFIEGAIELLTLVKAKESLLGEKYWVFKNAFGQYILAEQTQKEFLDFVTKTSDVEEINSIAFNVERKLQELVGKEDTIGNLNDQINIILGNDGVYINIDELDGQRYFDEKYESWSYLPKVSNYTTKDDEIRFDAYFERIGEIQEYANDTLVRLTEIEHWYNDSEEIK